MLKIKKYRDEDFHILENFFKQWEWTPCDKATIAKNAYFIYYKNSPIAFSNFATTDTNVAILGFTISDKNADKYLLSQALDMLLVYLFDKAKELGYEYMHYATDSVPMVKRLDRLKLMQITDNATGYLLTGSLSGKSIDFFDE
jgi:hypothetical protein